MHLAAPVPAMALAPAANAASLGSASTPAYCAEQILRHEPFATDDIYWIDPDGAGGAAAFQNIADMTMAGGGWTMGLQSFSGTVAATTDMASETGTVGSTDSHTRDMSDLAINQSARIRHRMVDGGVVIFDGDHIRPYHETVGALSGWTLPTGSAAMFGSNLDRARSASASDVDCVAANRPNDYDSSPWCYDACWEVRPGYADLGAAATGAGNSIDSYRILVRELTPPDLPGARAPPPTPTLLLVAGMASLGAIRAASRAAH
jgi:hypothetical protein